MLIGEYIHTIDEKNRISLPAKFRKEMGKKVIITPGLDQCLFIFTTAEWQKVSKRLSDSNSDLSFLSAEMSKIGEAMAKAGQTPPDATPPEEQNPEVKDAEFKEKPPENPPTSGEAPKA